MPSTGEQGAVPRLDEYGRRRLIQVSMTMIIMLVVIFTFAGHISYLWGWVYFGISILSLVLGGAYVLKHNPQAINERGRPAKDQKSWDKIIVGTYSLLFVSVYIISGLDFRFGWSSIPLWLHILGATLTLFSSGITYAAMAHNKFLSLYVQVAQERGHLVASSGPYRFIRHPMYNSLVLGWPSLAFLLGSYWALIPGTLASVLIIIRTALEDRTLLAELPGYADYARNVRYRLFPGLW